MNYSNYTMDELSVIIRNEPDPDCFIEAAKVFIAKFLEDEYISKVDLETKLESSYEEGYDKGYAQAEDDLEENN